jgi:hypothetical protein
MAVVAFFTVVVARPSPGYLSLDRPSGMLSAGEAIVMAGERLDSC